MKCNQLHVRIYIQLNLVMSNSVYSKLRLSRNFSEVPFQTQCRFQVNLLVLSQILMCRNFGYLEVSLQSLIYIFIKIIFVKSKLSIKSINKPVQVSVYQLNVLSPFTDKVRNYCITIYRLHNVDVAGFRQTFYVNTLSDLSLNVTADTTYIFLRN